MRSDMRACWLSLCLATVSVAFVLNRSPLHPRWLGRPSRKSAMVQPGAKKVYSRVLPLRARVVPVDPPLPTRADLLRGFLPNGLEYLVLPTPNSSNRDHAEAHLEILSGSADELDHQQGMAHLLEHVTFMGSPGRNRIAGEGARTNAHTDFHHTVYYSSAPNDRLLPAVFDTLSTVLEPARITESMLAKEKAAVLSELSMVNSMDHRIDRAVLAALHRDNLLSRRFPAGKPEQIARWNISDVRDYHTQHYRPDNAVLYVVGNFNPKTVVKMVREKFGRFAGLPAQPLGEVGRNVMSRINRHFPPVIHQWTNPIRSTGVSDNRSYILDRTRSQQDVSEPNVTLFQNNLLKAFSFHILAKNPILPINSPSALKANMLKQLVLHALLVRLSIRNREDALYKQISLTQEAFPREACEVWSLDLTAESAQWRAAVATAVEELTRVALKGFSAQERDRSILIAKQDIEVAFASAPLAQNEVQVEALMHDEACGHTHMNAWSRRNLSLHVLDNLTENDFKDTAAEMLSFITTQTSTIPGDSRNFLFPATIAVCSPFQDISGRSVIVSSEQIVGVIAEAIHRSLHNNDDAVLLEASPISLLSRNETEMLVRTRLPQWKSIHSHHGAGAEGFRARLDNGLSVAFRNMESEPRTVSLRMFFRGGRQLETAETRGALILGSQALQEGGAFRNVSREALELFCLDHMILLEVVPRPDGLIVDMKVSVDTEARNNESDSERVSNLEAAMQIIYALMTDLKWDEPSFLKARQLVFESIGETKSDLERACKHEIAIFLANNRSALIPPTREDIEKLKIDDVRDIMKKQMKPELLELAIAGDVSSDQIKKLLLQYLEPLGTRERRHVPYERGGINAGFILNDTAKNYFREVRLLDSEPRGIAYIAGPSPNKMGVLADGTSIGEALLKYRRTRSEAKTSDTESTKTLTSAQLHAALLVLQEVASRRLFTIVREERQLTYDADFKFSFENSWLNGHFFTVSVSSLPSLLALAIGACRDALDSLLTASDSSGRRGVSSDDVNGAKKVVINRFIQQNYSTFFWVNELLESEESYRDPKSFERDVASISHQDIQDLSDILLAKVHPVLTVAGTTGVDDTR